MMNIILILIYLFFIKHIDEMLKHSITKSVLRFEN